MVEKRLYGKFTLDYPDSHKIAPLSDAAFRTHVEMVLWSRRYLTDGRVPAAMAKVLSRGRTKVLRELCTNDSEHPSLTQDENGDFWLHDFLDHQPSKDAIEAIQAVNRENGAKGGRTKGANANRTAKRTATDSLSETEAKLYTETETETENKIATDVAISAAPPALVAIEPKTGFDDFWNTYPRKADKATARKAWAKALKTTDPDQIIAGAARYAGDPNRDPQFTKLPATWLNAEAWGNEPLPARTSNNGRESSLDRLARQRQQAFADLETLNNNQKAIGR